MLTFQILDAGDTYLRPLEDRTVTVGSDSAADIKLSDEGVEGIHAEVTVAGSSCRITANAQLKVNGEDRSEAELTLGDRVELGRAVLVLGQQVKRPATAADVLDSSAPTRRREPFADQRSPQVKRMIVGVLLGGAALAFVIWQWGKTEQGRYIPDQQREGVVHARTQGRFAEAERLLAAVESDRAGTDADRLQLVARQRGRVRDTREAFDRLHAQFMAEVLDKKEREQIVELKAVRKTGSPSEQEAAVILMAGLREFRIAAERVARANQPASEGGVTVAKKGRRKVEGMGNPDLPKPAWLDERMAEIRAYHGKKNFVHAIELARVTLPDVPVLHAEGLRDLMADIRAAARKEMHALVSQAYAMRKNGRLADGVKLLQAEARRFPGEGNLSYLYRELGQLAAELGVPGPQSPVVQLPPRPRIVAAGKPKRPVVEAGDRKTGRDPATKDPAVVEIDEPELVSKPSGRLDKRLIARVLRDAAAAERAGDFAKALQLLQESIDQNHDYQPQLADHLRGVRVDLQRIQAFAAALDGRPLAGHTVKTTAGDRVKLAKVENQRIILAGNEAATVPWLEVSVSSAEALAEAAGVAPELRLAIAVLGYRQGDAAGAEGFLARLLSADTRLFAKASQVIGRGRGEYVDEQGYALIKGKFVARRFVAVEKLAKAFGRKIQRLAGQTAAEREQILRELRADQEPGAGDALVLALRQRMDELADKLSRSSLPKALEKLRVQRAELDQARRHAKDLIYDTEKYFYPYKPPAVSGARYSEYMKVQKEVDIRVAALRKLWMDKTKVGVAVNVRKEIDLLVWIEDELGKMGEVADAVLQRVDWVHTIPPVSTLTLRNFCSTAEEKDNLVHYLEIELLNEAAVEDLNDGEVTLIEITNSYRAMFGHRPLAVDLRLQKSSRGHAEEMATLGYFSHTSPTPGRKSAFQRMKNAGYDYGISENIAMNPSAEGAHYRWCHSSGHHRNLLNASHTEVGMGNSGKYWVQNFGRGTSYRER